jgi:hypothetical protein
MSALNAQQFGQFTAILSVSCVMCFMPTTVSAADSKSRFTHSGKKITEERFTAADSSEVHRQDKEFYLVAELIGFNPLFSSGITGGLFLNPDSIVDISYTHGSFQIWGLKVVQDAIALRYKKFESNSFYWRAGLGYRAFKMKSSVLFDLTDKDLDLEGKATSLGLDFAIGNQWQWSAFTIGCDWIGYFQPLVGQSEVNKPTGVDDSDYERRKKDMKKFSDNGSGQLLRFYLGVSF